MRPYTITAAPLGVARPVDRLGHQHEQRHRDGEHAVAELQDQSDQPALRTDRTGLLYVVVYFAVVTIAVLLFPKAAAFFYLLVALAAVFRTHGEGLC